MPEYGRGPYGRGRYGIGYDVAANPYAPPVPAVATFATPQAVLDAPHTDTRLTVYIDGTLLTDVPAWSGQHRVGETATGTISLLLPRHPAIQPNAAIEVQAGHNDLVGTIFSGFIPDRNGSMTERGNLLDVQAVGWSALMAEPQYTDLVYQGPIGLDALFVAVALWVGVPSYIAMVTTYPDGVTPIMLGGNSRSDDGKVIIKAHSSPLAQLQRLAEPYGYFVTDLLQGPVLLHRVSGMPIGEPVVRFIEGLHLGTARRGYDVREIVNVWDVIGITYEDEFGGRVPIRSIADPAAVPPHPEIRGGYRYREYRNSDIVRQDQADAIRNRREIDYSAATAPVQWDAVALPGLNPGDCVVVDSETAESPDNRLWLMGFDLAHDDDGFTARYEGWAGAGQELPGIVDRVVRRIQTDPVHLGDETVPWYAHPADQGIERAWPFTLPDNVAVANVRGWHHSTNSQLVGGENTELQVSKWEFWLAGVDRTNEDNRPESSGTMPRLPEDFALQRPYSEFEVDAEGNVTDPGYWTPFAVNLRTLDAGDYVLVLKAGEGEGYDDFEVRLVDLELFGTVQPAVNVMQEAA